MGTILVLLVIQRENDAFWFLRGFILDLGVGWLSLLFQFILFKSVVKITLRWVVRRKISHSLD